METPIVTFIRKSTNDKIGKIPATRTEKKSCPITCPLYNSGCYAKTGPESWQWAQKKMEKNAITWQELLQKIQDLPENQLWRHNTAGDLPQDGMGNININAFMDLVMANKGKKGFTYTHHALNTHNLAVIKQANFFGFAVNISTESIEQADKVMTEHNLPAVAVIHSDLAAKRFLRTESGRKVIICPAALHKEGIIGGKKISCETCGICANIDRETIVAFPAHGVRKELVNEVVG